MPRKFYELSDKIRWDRFDELVARQMGRLMCGVEHCPLTPDMDNTDVIDHDLDSSFYSSATPSSMAHRKDGLPGMAKSLITLLDITVQNLEGFQSLDELQDPSFAENFHEIRESYRNIQMRASDLKSRIEKNICSGDPLSHVEQNDMPEEEVDGHRITDVVGADLPHRAREMSRRLGQLLTLQDSEFEDTRSLAREVTRVLDFVCRLSQLLQREASWPHAKIDTVQPTRVDDVDTVVAMVTHNVVRTPESSQGDQNQDSPSNSNEFNISRVSTNLREDRSYISFSMSELSCMDSSASPLHSESVMNNEDLQRSVSTDDHTPKCPDQWCDVSQDFGSKLQLHKPLAETHDCACVYLSHDDIRQTQDTASVSPSDVVIPPTQDSVCTDLSYVDIDRKQDSLSGDELRDDISQTEDAICVDVSLDTIHQAENAACTDLSDADILPKQDVVTRDVVLQDDISVTHDAVCIDLSHDYINQGEDTGCTDLSDADILAMPDAVSTDALQDDTSQTQDAVCKYLTHEDISQTQDATIIDELQDDISRRQEDACIDLSQEDITPGYVASRDEIQDGMSQTQEAECLDLFIEDMSQSGDIASGDVSQGDLSQQQDAACREQSQVSIHDSLDYDELCNLHHTQDSPCKDDILLDDVHCDHDDEHCDHDDEHCDHDDVHGDHDDVHCDHDDVHCDHDDVHCDHESVNGERSQDSMCQADDYFRKDQLTDDVCPIQASVSKEKSLDNAKLQVQDSASREQLLIDGMGQLTNSISGDRLEDAIRPIHPSESEEQWHDAICPVEMLPIGEEWYDAISPEQVSKKNVYTVMNATVASSMDHRYMFTGIASALDEGTIKGNNKRNVVASRETAIRSRPCLDKFKTVCRGEESFIDSGVWTKNDSSTTAPTDDSSLKLKVFDLSLPSKRSRQGLRKGQGKKSEKWPHGGLTSLGNITGTSYHVMTETTNCLAAKKSKSDGLMARSRRKKPDKLSITYSSVCKKIIGERTARFRSFIAKKQANYLLMTNPLRPAADSTLSELSSSPDPSCHKGFLLGTDSPRWYPGTQRRRALSRYRPKCVGSSDTLVMPKNRGINTRTSQSPAQTRLSPHQSSDGYLDDDSTAETSDESKQRRRGVPNRSNWERGTAWHQRSSSVPPLTGSRRPRTPLDNPSSAWASYQGTSHQRPFLQPNESGQGTQAVLPPGSPVKVRIFCKEGSSKDKNKVTSIKSGNKEIDIRRVKRSPDRNFKSDESDAAYPARLVKLAGASPGYSIVRPSPSLIRVQMDRSPVGPELSPSDNPDAGHPSAKAVRLRVFPRGSCDVYVNVHIPDGSESPSKSTSPTKAGASYMSPLAEKLDEESIKSDKSGKSGKTGESSKGKKEPVAGTGTEDESIKSSKPGESRKDEKGPVAGTGTEDGSIKSSKPGEEPKKSDEPRPRSRRDTLDSLRSALTDPLTRSSLPLDEVRKASISKEGDISIHSSRKGSIKSLIDQIDDDLRDLQDQEAKEARKKSDQERLSIPEEEEEGEEEKEKEEEEDEESKKRRLDARRKSQPEPKKSISAGKVKPIAKPRTKKGDRGLRGEGVKAFLRDWLKYLLLLPLLWLLYCLLLVMYEPCASCFNPLGGVIGWLSRVISRNLRLIHFSPPPL